MSNKTPAAIRAKDRERKLREKHAKQVKAERKARWRSGATRLRVLSIFLIFTGIPALLTYFPRLTISENGTLRSRDVMGTVFNLNNNGALPIYDVVQFCGMDQLIGQNGQNLMSDLSIVSPPLGYLGAGDTKSFTCPGFRSLNVGTKMIMSITYRPLLWFRKVTKRFLLQAEKADDGAWIWKSM